MCHCIHVVSFELLIFQPVEVKSGPILKAVDGLWVGLEQRELSSC